MSETQEPRRPMPAGKFFDVIVWNFANDQERRTYLSTRRPIWREIPWVLLCAVAYFLGTYAVRWDIGESVQNGVIFGAIIGGSRMIMRRTGALRGVKITFNDNRMRFYERQQSLFQAYDTLIWAVTVKNIVSASWGSDGVIIVKRWFGTTKLLFLSYHILGTDQAFKAFTDWCVHNEIQIDGAIPLKGTYVRPHQEPRGL